MAVKKATSRVRSNRSRMKKATLEVLPDLATYESIEPGNIEEAIEDERGRLMKAEAILHCVAIAMDESEGDNTRAPCYQAALSVARDLLVQSINRLDTVRVRPMLDDRLRLGQDGIKESAPKYLH
jgi:hypothetical protein